MRLFNRHAQEAFASEHAYSQEMGAESIEVALYLETKLRGRLALPPNANMHYDRYAVQNANVDAAVLERAAVHVQGAGSHGPPAFLACQGGVEFNAWVEHLRKKCPEKFEEINQNVSVQQKARARELGGHGGGP